ncbi:ATP synthase F1 subunit gamma [Patescibacteria group bacterium]|nr:ATP synthase F1 subunit gamma [Patescibacteria group bacterium]
MAGTRDIKRRIRSVRSTKKITRAMQMVSAAKMRKAQAAVSASRSYSELAWQIIKNLSKKIDPKYHSLLQAPQNNKKTGVILISSNRGLIGSFNTNLILATKKYIADNAPGSELVADIIAVGRKGRDAMLRVGNTIFAEFDKVDRTVRLEEVLPIGQLIIDEYIKGTYGKIAIAYTHFNSTISQKPVIKQLLPLPEQEHPEGLPQEIGRQHYQYLFEPDPQQVLDYLLPRILESQIYQAILESDASEHSSRMVMMKNATDAATDLIDDLTLAYNKMRQANITKELAEITAGKIALE